MTTSNPWKKLSTRIVYENPWIRVREDAVIQPDGKQGIYGVLETRLATGVVALSERNEVYLVGQYRYATDMYSWEIIEGGSDHGEDPLETAKRELQEEAGLVAGRWEQIGSEIHLSNCISAERGYLYLARDLEEVSASPEGTEVLQIRKVPFDQVLSMIDSGEIVDAMTIMGIFLAQRRLVPRPGSS